MIEKEQGYWIIIPTVLVEGNHTKALLYGIIGSYCNSSGVCFASNATLAQKLGMETGGRLRQYLTELENEGWIFIEDRGGKSRKMYITSRFQPATKKHQPATKVAGQPATKSAHSIISRVLSESSSEKETFSHPSLIPKIPGVVMGSEYQPDHNPPKRRKRTATPKQAAQMPILALMDHFRDAVSEIHGLSYLHRPEDRNAKIKRQVDSCYARFGDGSRAFVDWWLNDSKYGKIVNYEPEACFTARVFREYENKDVIAAKEESGANSPYPMNIAGFVVRNDQELASAHQEGIIYPIDATGGKWGLTPKGKEVINHG